MNKRVFGDGIAPRNDGQPVPYPPINVEYEVRVGDRVVKSSIRLAGPEYLTDWETWRAVGAVIAEMVYGTFFEQEAAEAPAIPK